MNILGITASQTTSAFSPTQIANLKAWWDPSDTTTITASSGKVSQMNDKSGNGWNLTQSTDAFRPITGTRTINSLNVIDFVDANDSLRTGTAADWKFLGNSTSSIFMIVRFDSLAARNFILSTGDNPTANTGWLFSALVTTGNIDHVVGGTTSQSILNRPGTGYAINTNYYLTILTDPTNGTAADRSKVYINAGAANAANTLTQATSTTDPQIPLSLGATGGQDPDTLAINGVIGEVIIYTGILSAGDQTKVKDYLAAKWGI